MDQDCPSGSLEQLNDPLHKANKLVERWNNWLAWEKRGFVKRYLGGHTKLAIRRVDVGPPYYGAILEPWPLRGHPESLGVCLGVNDDPVGDQIDLDESLMLSCDVHLVEGVEQIVPSRIRLHTFDDRAVNIAEPFFSFGFSQRIDEVGMASVNRKVVVGSRRYAFATSQRRGEHVQTGPDTVHYRADASVDLGWKAAVYLQLKELLPRLRVCIVFNQQEWGAVEPGFESMLEGIKVGSGPINGPVGVF
jgi:hypothetical protein